MNILMLRVLAIRWHNDRSVMWTIQAIINWGQGIACTVCIRPPTVGATILYMVSIAQWTAAAASWNVRWNVEYISVGTAHRLTHFGSIFASSHITIYRQQARCRFLKMFTSSKPQIETTDPRQWFSSCSPTAFNDNTIHEALRHSSKHHNSAAARNNSLMPGISMVLGGSKIREHWLRCLAMGHKAEAEMATFCPLCCLEMNQAEQWIRLFASSSLSR